MLDLGVGWDLDGEFVGRQLLVFVHLLDRQGNRDSFQRPSDHNTRREFMSSEILVGRIGDLALQISLGRHTNPD